MTEPKGVPAFVWPKTRGAASQLQERLKAVLGRPVPLTEVWDRAVTLAMSASDEDLQRGEL